MNNAKLILSVGLGLLLTWHGSAHAQSNIVLVNTDPAGAGLNDPTPVKPLPSNPGRTLGQQRINAYQYAMDLWGALLSSNVDIRVEASFSPLTCQPGRVVLGQAGTRGWVRDFDNAPKAGTDYVIALANSRAGVDLEPARNDIHTYFNSELGTEACGNSEWFYGLYGNGENIEGRSNFLNVIMHEIGHGLGMNHRVSLFSDDGALGFLNRGSMTGRAGYTDLAFSNVFNHALNDLTDAQRLSALRTPGSIIWSGRRTNEAAALIADTRTALSVTAPAAAVGRYPYLPADFGRLGQDGVVFPAAQLVLMRDVVSGGGTPTSLGCSETIANAGELRGRIALIDRGTCEFATKALNAQRNGAVAVVIANNTGTEPLGMAEGADGSQVTIPSISVSLPAGQRLRSTEPVQVSGMVEVEGSYAGLDDDGRLRLYVNSQIQEGSTLAHVDVDMSPNALMEPSETRTLISHAYVDVALDMFEELGWRTNRNATAKLGNCDTGVPVVRDGFIPGANLIAQQRLCKTSSAGSRAKYESCMSNHAIRLRGDQLLSNDELLNVRQCLRQR